MQMVASVCRRWSSSSAVPTVVENVGRLRKETGVSLAQCKEAVKAGNNNYQDALQWLHKNNHLLASAKASKLGSRSAAEGLVVVARGGNSSSSRSGLSTATLIELNCETDFVTRNDKFQDLAAQISSSFHASLLSPSSSAPPAPPPPTGITDIDPATLKE